MVDVAEEVQAPGDDTQHLNAIFGNIRGYRARIADLEKLLARAEQEIATQRLELARLRRGEGITILIEGRSFSLSVDGPTAFDTSSLIAPEVRDELSQKLTAVDRFKQVVGLPDGAFLNDQVSGTSERLRLEDSFMLSKD